MAQETFFGGVDAPRMKRSMSLGLALGLLVLVQPVRVLRGQRGGFDGPELRPDHRGQCAAARPAGTADLPVRHLRRRGLLGRPAAPPRGNCRRAERRRRSGCQPGDGARRRAQGRLRRAPARAAQAAQAGRGRSRRSGDHAGAAEARRGGRRHRPVRPEWPDHVDRHPVRPLPFHGGRLLRTRHRPPPRWLAEPRPGCRRRGRTRTRPVAGREPARGRRGDRANGPRELGPGSLRRPAPPRRQGVQARRSHRRGAHPACVRPRGREPAHLRCVGKRALLERVRREPRDARQGHVRRRSIERPRAVSRRGGRGLCERPVPA